jgi:NodT family efflux transporter outer membrane factor (OMF) lipoprotein
LDQWIAEALRYNNELAAASQRIIQARAQASIAGAGLWPTAGMEANLAGNHTEFGETQRKSGILSVAYEVDLWGANRGRRDAGQARLLGEVYARDALQLVVMADVSQRYFELLATEERKRIAVNFLENVDAVLQIIEARFNAGAVSALDVAQQQTEQANARANLNALNQQQALLENSLSILLGKAPADFIGHQERFADLKLPDIPPQQPLSLLQRRPDLRQQEMQLKAANLDVGIAQAQFFPKLQLNLDTLLANPQPAGLALAMAANLAQPLFQGGRLEGGLETAEARKAELMENYQQALLIAFKEVEDAAAIRRHATHRQQALTQAVEYATEAYEISTDRYRVGAIDYPTLLNTQRSLFNAQTSEVQARLEVLQALVQLLKALGGGFGN